MNAPPRIRPILKWAGGKFRLLDAILPELHSGKRLVEPFVGSGAVFLNSDFPAYLLCDLNADLIRFYRTLAKKGAAFIEECRALFVDGNSADVFYRRREAFNRLAPGFDRTALFLYFNRHGYNGLVRYNSRGAYNVPFGKYLRPYFPEAEMLAFVEKTRRCRVEFATCDFRESFRKVSAGDCVYCDPPYIPLSDTANFTAYAGNSFDSGDQRALAGLAEKAAGRKIRVVLSNHDAGEARELYSKASRTHTLTVRRSISCNGGKRGKAPELLVVYGE